MNMQAVKIASTRREEFFFAVDGILGTVFGERVENNLGRVARMKL